MKHNERVAKLEEAMAFANKYCHTADKRTGLLAPVEAWEYQEIIGSLAQEVHRLRKEVRDGH